MSVIQMVLDNNWADLNTYVEKQTAIKIKEKIEEKKKDIIKDLNSKFSSEE